MEVPPNDGSSMSKRKNPNGTDDDRGYPYDLGTPHITPERLIGEKWLLQFDWNIGFITQNGAL